MSQHTSLKYDPTRTRHRNVLKRHERIRRLRETSRWNDRLSVFGLPKVKSVKIRVKKVKAEKAEGEATAATAATPTGAPAPPAAAPKAPPAAKKPGSEKAKPGAGK